MVFFFSFGVLTPVSLDFDNELERVATFPSSTCTMKSGM